ncbi:MAG TPA: MFS transporter [Pseudogracilibacillus sp.]|nr:MFS transporter [Pseudogracilibacillus sp.]
MKSNKSQSTSKFYRILPVLGVLIIAFNLRPAITSVGPLIGTIRDDVGFSNWSVAFLTSLPLIAFAIMSPLAPRLGKKVTNPWALTIGLVLLITGIGLRSLSFVAFLFIGTLLIGMGIAVCNVLLPSVIKEKFPLKVAVMTSMYTTGMVLLATTASGVSIPIAEDLHFGWQWSLFVWAAPAVIGIVIWIMIALKSNDKKTDEMDETTEKQQSSGIWKSKVAWHVALFMGLQSFMFYVTISWLTEMLIDFGTLKTTAGFMVSYFQLLGIPVSMIMPVLAMKLKSQSTLVFSVNILFMSGLILLLLQNSFTMVLIAVSFIGLASSSNFALALTFLSIRAKNAQDAADLSGMAQSVGYVLAATGPILIGSIYDMTDGWTIPIFCLIIVVIGILYFGSRAGQHRYVFYDEKETNNA